MTRVIDFAKRENAAGGPSDPDIIAARLLHRNCGVMLETQKNKYHNFCIYTGGEGAFTQWVFCK